MFPVDKDKNILAYWKMLKTDRIRANIIYPANVNVDSKISLSLFVARIVRDIIDDTKSEKRSVRASNKVAK